MSVSIDYKLQSNIDNLSYFAAPIPRDLQDMSLLAHDCNIVYGEQGVLPSTQYAIRIKNSVVEVQNRTGITLKQGAIIRIYLSANSDVPAVANKLSGYSNIGTRVLDHRLATYTNDGLGTTWHLVMEVAQHFDAVRFIFSNNQTSGTQAFSSLKCCSLASLANDTLINNSDGSNGAWATVTRNNSGTITLDTAGSANRPRVTLTDWITLSSQDRTDGQENPVIAVRGYLAGTTSNVPVMGNGTDDFTNWVTRPQHKWISRMKVNNHVSTLTGFDSTTNLSQSPIIGVQYLARGRVVTVWMYGDSITSGRGTYLGEGWGLLACEKLSNMSGVAVECANYGWSSQTVTQYGSMAADHILSDSYRMAKFASDGTTLGNLFDFLTPSPFDVVVYSAWSPNSASTPITASEIETMKQYTARVIGACAQVKAVPILWTGLPVDPGTKNFGSSDSLRVGFNDFLLGLNKRGIRVMDFASVLSGVTNSSGQILPANGSMTGGIHPTDAYNRTLSEIFAGELGAIIAATYGYK